VENIKEGYLEPEGRSSMGRNLVLKIFEKSIRKRSLDPILGMLAIEKLY